jgi:hypothetical protein
VVADHQSCRNQGRLDPLFIIKGAGRHLFHRGTASRATLRGSYKQIQRHELAHIAFGSGNIRRGRLQNFLMGL